MSWKKTIKGTFGEVREQIDGLAEEVRGKQGKVTESNEKSVNAHALQARIAQFAASQITAQCAGEENFVLNVSGEVEPDGSGSVTIEYGFGAPKKKAKRS